MIFLYIDYMFHFHAAASLSIYFYFSISFSFSLFSYISLFIFMQRDIILPLYFCHFFLFQRYCFRPPAFLLLIFFFIFLYEILSSYFSMSISHVFFIDISLIIISLGFSYFFRFSHFHRYLILNRVYFWYFHLRDYIYIFLWDILLR